MHLHELKQNCRARVVSIGKSNAGPGSVALENKLREVGFAEDDEVEILHYGPLGRRPLCVRLNHTVIALRLREAAAIEVAPLAATACETAERESRV